MRLVSILSTQHPSLISPAEDRRRPRGVAVPLYETIAATPWPLVVVDAAAAYLDSRDDSNTSRGGNGPGAVT